MQKPLIFIRFHGVSLALHQKSGQKSDPQVNKDFSVLFWLSFETRKLHFCHKKHRHGTLLVQSRWYPMKALCSQCLVRPHRWVAFPVRPLRRRLHLRCHGVSSAGGSRYDNLYLVVIAGNLRCDHPWGLGQTEKNHASTSSCSSCTSS